MTTFLVEACCGYHHHKKLSAKLKLWKGYATTMHSCCNETVVGSLFLSIIPGGEGSVTGYVAFQKNMGGK